MKRGQRGFTLVELAVVMAISATIVAGASMTAVQSINGAQRNDDHATVVRQAQNVGTWFSRDVRTAQRVSSGDDPETDDIELMTTYSNDWESGYIYSTRYVLVDYAGSMKKLKRNQVVHDKEGIVINNVTTLVAESISSANVTEQDNTWCLYVETSSGQKTLNREYRVNKRIQ